MLSPGGAPAASRIVAFTCARAIEALPPPYLELPLPCVALVTPWAILRALSLGAAGIAVITGNSPCRDRHDPEGLEQEIRASGKILEALGVEADRIVGLDASAPPGLSEFETLLGRMSRVPWQGDGALAPPLGLGSLVARMARAMPGAARPPVVAPELPFASVEVDPARCSLCGLCALCPGGAIERHEEADDSALTFRYAHCTGCTLCREICPEKAIRLTPVLAPARLREGPRTLVASRLVRCQSCGTPIAPAPMLEAVARRMAARGGAAQVLPEISRFCPACRLSVPIGESVLPQAGAPAV
jgi:ferredoxin/coenzyme F420-reducing hydrogenase delta subunit